MDESTLLALGSIIVNLKERKLYVVFEIYVIPLLNLVYKIQEKQNYKFSSKFVNLYNLLFDKCYTLISLSTTNCKSIKIRIIMFHFYNNTCIFSLYFR
jgi:hypothetical protein